jgi:L-rhamnose isomerase/sugar isomerase
MRDFGFRISKDAVEKSNKPFLPALREDYDALGSKLARGGMDLDSITDQVSRFTVAVPSWGLGTGGTRFGRFPNDSEPRDVWEKLVDASTVNELGGQTTPRVSLHIPWDKPDDPSELLGYAGQLGISFDAMNSNTFQDQKNGQKFSYKFGSLCHTDKAVRDQAVAHNKEVIDLGLKLKSEAVTVWLSDGGSYPGQQHFRNALERVVDGLREIYRHLPGHWRLFTEHKPYEPQFYSTINFDWGTSYLMASALGEKAQCLVDLGHHLPNTNIEMVVARLIGVGKLGGFHLNDSKYGDDDLSTGSIKPYQLFLIFNELVDAARDPKVKGFNPAYMLDQSHNLKDPIEDLILSGQETRRAYCKALLVDRVKLEEAQRNNDVVTAETTLKAAADTDVSPVLAMARVRGGGAVDPIAAFRASGYRKAKAAERPQVRSTSGGIV